MKDKYEYFIIEGFCDFSYIIINRETFEIKGLSLKEAKYEDIIDECKSIYEEDKGKDYYDMKLGSKYYEILKYGMILESGKNTIMLYTNDREEFIRKLSQLEIEHYEKVNKIVISDKDKKLVEECKKAYKKNDLKSAYEFWSRIYDNHSIENLKTEMEKRQVTEELFNVMKLFDDDEVYNITDYGKRNAHMLNKDTLEIGKILENGKVIKEYYGPGYIYKNLDNFDNKKGPCYIAEYQGEIEQNNGKMETKNFNVMIEGEDYETYNTIIKMITEEFERNNIDSSKIPIEDFAKEVFLDVDWQHISTLVSEYIEDFDEEYFLEEIEET